MAKNDLLTTVGDAATTLVDELRNAAQVSDRSSQFSSVKKAMDRCLQTLAATLVWGLDNRTPSRTLWSVAQQLLRLGSLQVHAREKPYGYAGDHEMLHRICMNEKRGDGLGLALDDYFQQQAAPCAVRNRADLVATSIVETVRSLGSRHARIVSVGSGPAHDIWLSAERLDPEERRRLDVHLVDLDPRAVAFCESRFSAEHAPKLGSLTTHRKNLKRLDRDAEAILGEADLIVCPGFLDYLNDQEVAEMLRMFFVYLRPNGRLLAFNFSVENPSRAYMEWMGNWYLIHRTVDQLETVSRHAGLPLDAGSIGCEAENVNLFVHVVK